MADNGLIGVIPVKDLHTVKRIPPTIRGTIYEAMLKAVSEELAIWRAGIGEVKTSFYDVDLADTDRLITLAKEFGVPFITTVKSDLDWLREEVRSIPFKILYKGTATLYTSFIAAVDRFGEMFIYTYREDLGGIEKSMKLPFSEAENTPQNKPFRHRSRGDFSGVIRTWISLDNDYNLDAGESLWRLDTSSSEISTNHIGIEYLIDRIIQRQKTEGDKIVSEELLMTKEYLDYMDACMEFGRRTKEVPHVGSQLSVQTDLTGLFNSFDPSMNYSVPDLKLKIAARPDTLTHAPTAYDIDYAEFGTGSHEIASVQNPDIPFPTDLAYRVARIPILFRGHYGNSDYIGAEGEYLGQTIQEIKLLSGNQWFDGVNKNFDFTLPVVPAQKGNVIFEFILPESAGSLVYQIKDDKKGGLISTYGKGSIDYETGNGVLSTDFEYNTSENIIEQSGEVTDRRHFIQGLVPDSQVLLTPGSIKISFMIGEGIHQRVYLVQDEREPFYNDNKGVIPPDDFAYNLIVPDTLAYNEQGDDGYFVHPKILNGKINYRTRIIDIEFTDPLVDPSIKPFKCSYVYKVDYVLPEGTELWVSYYFTQQTVSITEAGFRSRDGTLIIYATFPPIEFSSNKYHCSFLALVKRNALT
jgi:hypothetical protein